MRPARHRPGFDLGIGRVSRTGSTAAASDRGDRSCMRFTPAQRHQSIAGSRVDESWHQPAFKPNSKSPSSRLCADAAVRSRIPLGTVAHTVGDCCSTQSQAPAATTEKGEPWPPVTAVLATGVATNWVHIDQMMSYVDNGPAASSTAAATHTMGQIPVVVTAISSPEPVLPSAPQQLPPSPPLPSPAPPPPPQMMPLPLSPRRARPSSSQLSNSPASSSIEPLAALNIGTTLLTARNLIVRRSVDRSSSILGRLPAGTVASVLQTAVEADGTQRVCVVAHAPDGSAQVAGSHTGVVSRGGMSMLQGGQSIRGWVTWLSMDGVPNLTLPSKEGVPNLALSSGRPGRDLTLPPSADEDALPDVVSSSTSFIPQLPKSRQHEAQMPSQLPAPPDLPISSHPSKHSSPSQPPTPSQPQTTPSRPSRPPEPPSPPSQPLVSSPLADELAVDSPAKRPTERTATKEKRAEPPMGTLHGFELECTGCTNGCTNGRTNGCTTSTQLGEPTASVAPPKVASSTCPAPVQGGTCCDPQSGLPGAAQATAAAAAALATEHRQRAQARQLARERLVQKHARQKQVLPHTRHRL